jgi:hypothetical protein
MRLAWVTIVFVAISCGGSLTDEQRKKAREEREASQIRKVTDAELTEASFEYGRQLIAAIESKDKSFTNQTLIDSLESAYHVRIAPLVPGDSLLLEIESQIIEAYTTGAGQVQLNDDVQKLGADSLLYTKPVMRELPDGQVEFVRAIGIHMPKKYVVLSIKD